MGVAGPGEGLGVCLACQGKRPSLRPTRRRLAGLSEVGSETGFQFGDTGLGVGGLEFSNESYAVCHSSTQTHF